MFRIFLAQSNTNIQLNAPVVSGGLGGVVSRVIGFILLVAGILSVIFVLVGAFQYVVSGGNPDATRKAKDTILYALIGLVVSASSYAIVKFILRVL